MKTQQTQDPKSLTKSDAELFIDLVMRGTECWLQAGEIVARNMDANPHFIDEVCDKCPDLSPETVVRFAQIGRKQLLPKLLISDAPGVRRLRKLPYALQQKYSSDPIPVVIASGDVLTVDVRNLTPDQAAQVFADDRIRSEAEQRAWMEDKKAKTAVHRQSVDSPYRIVGKKLVIVQPCQLTSRDLARVLADMES